MSYKRLHFSVRTSLVLSNEDYTNAGLDQEEMMKAIERIDGVWMVEKYPINKNIQVHIKGRSKEYIRDIIDEIKMTLDWLLEKNLDK